MEDVLPKQTNKKIEGKGHLRKKDKDVKKDNILSCSECIQEQHSILVEGREKG